MITPKTNINTMAAQYRCPLCHEQLAFENKSYRCANNHSFDQAKQGYVNLLPVQFKHSKEPGDNKAMVQARRAFLDQGYYQPLVDAMLALYGKYGESTGRIFDAGCGGLRQRSAAGDLPRASALRDTAQRARPTESDAAFT